MGQINGLGPKRTFKLAKRGKVNCTECNQFVPMIKLPLKLPFVQETLQKSKSQVESIKAKFCALCGHEINSNAKFCENCGGEQ